MKIAKYWLALAVTALGLSGIFTILLIIGRTSNLLKSFLAESFFAPSLVVHVNLDVLVWLLAMVVAYFNYEKQGRNWLPLAAAVVGTALITVSPFTGAGEAYTNNYIPIFDNLYFKLGIGLFLAAVAFEAVTTLASKCAYRTKTIAALLVMAFTAFVGSYIGIQDKISSHYMYEFMFWGGGHIMQFVYVQIMAACWLVLAQRANLRLPGNARVMNIIFTLPLVFAAVSTVYIYASVKVESTLYVQLFTKQMIFGTALAAIPLGVLVVAGMCRGVKWGINEVSLALSIFLFIIGGALGNVAAKAVANGDITTVIPAHYHFSSVAVSVALMGYIYSIIPLRRVRLAQWQIILYTIGQTIYFGGMAILGGHGAARKTPGVDMIQMDEHSKKMVEHFMHSGGSLSLIGGILFVAIVLGSLRHSNSSLRAERGNPGS